MCRSACMQAHASMFIYACMFPWGFTYEWLFICSYLFTYTHGENMTVFLQMLLYKRIYAGSLGNRAGYIILYIRDILYITIFPSVGNAQKHDISEACFLCFIYVCLWIVSHIRITLGEVVKYTHYFTFCANRQTLKKLLGWCWRTRCIALCWTCKW